MQHMPHLGFPRVSDGKESACSAGDLGSITGLGRPLEEGMATHSSIRAWRIPQTEEPGGYSSWGLQTRLKQLCTHALYQNLTGGF